MAYIFCTSPDSALALPLLFLSRFVYGITLNSFAIPSLWAGVHVPMLEKAKVTALFNGLVSIGVTTGPTIGSVVASVLPKELSASSPGFVTVVGSIGMLLLLAIFLDDTSGGKLPAAPKKASGEEQQLSSEEKEKETKLLTILQAVNVNLGAICLSCMSGFEALMGLMMYEGYGWDAAEQVPFWLLFSISAVVCNLSMPMLMEYLNSSKIVLFHFFGLLLCLVPINYSAIDGVSSSWRFGIGEVGTAVVATS